MVIIEKTPLVLGTIFTDLIDWNVILILLGFCSLISLAVFIERLLQLRRSKTDTRSFMPRLREALRQGNVKRAQELCDETPGAVSLIIKSGLNRHDKGKEQIESAMEVTGLLEIAQMERNAKILSIIAHIAPLIGLLGTVLGFIQAFGEMRASGMMDVSTTQIGAAMEFALETTAAGLAVAIPTVVAYNYIVSRIEASLLEIQTAASEVLDLLLHGKEKRS